MPDFGTLHLRTSIRQACARLHGRDLAGRIVLSGILCMIWTAEITSTTLRARRSRLCGRGEIIRVSVSVQRGRSTRSAYVCGGVYPCRGRHAHSILSKERKAVRARKNQGPLCSQVQLSPGDRRGMFRTSAVRDSRSGRRSMRAERVRGSLAVRTRPYNRDLRSTASADLGADLSQ